MKWTCPNSSLNEAVLVSLVNDWVYIPLHLQVVTGFASPPLSTTLWISSLKEIKWICLYVSAIDFVYTQPSVLEQRCTQSIMTILFQEIWHKGPVFQEPDSTPISNPTVYMILSAEDIAQKHYHYRAFLQVPVCSVISRQCITITKFITPVWH